MTLSRPQIQPWSLKPQQTNRYDSFYGFDDYDHLESSAASISSPLLALKAEGLRLQGSAEAKVLKRVAHVFDDRKLYKPNETLHLKGYVRELTVDPTSTQLTGRSAGEGDDSEAVLSYLHKLRIPPVQKVGEQGTPMRLALVCHCKDARKGFGPPIYAEVRSDSEGEEGPGGRASHGTVVRGARKATTTTPQRTVARSAVVLIAPMSIALPCAACHVVRR